MFQSIQPAEKALTIFGACGPYTSQDSLSYEPLADLIAVNTNTLLPKDLLYSRSKTESDTSVSAYFPPHYEPLSQKVQEESPDVLILLGPFVDVKHPLIEKCDIGNITLEELFNNQINYVIKNIPATTHVS